MSEQTLHLTREGVSIVLTPSSSGVPTIVHWGAALGDGDDAGLTSTSTDPEAGWGVVVATTGTVVTQAPPPVQLPGLDPDRTCLLSCETPAGERHTSDLGTTWLRGEPIEVSGAVLTTVGFQLPVLAPESAVVLRVSARA